MTTADTSAALQQIPYSISVVTVGRGQVENALTVSWFSQVSFDPPMLMVAIDRVHYSEEFIRSTKSFVVNLLGEDQRALAGHFARESQAGEDKLAGLAVRPAPSGAAILEGALAYFDCELESIQPVGDHLIVLGRVGEAGVLREGKPLTTAAGMRYHKSRPHRAA